MPLRSNLRRKLVREQSGTVVILFALLLIPIAGLMAGALDFARQTSVKQDLQESLDSAALAVAKYIQANDTGDPAKLAALHAEARAVGNQMFLANFTPAVGVPAPQPEFKFDGDRVAASADVEFPAAFLGILGITRLGAGGYTEAVVPGRMNAEIVLVLDYSGSMKDNDKYKRMASAAKDFIIRIKQTGDNRTLVALVPFSDFVFTDVRGRYVRDVLPALNNKVFGICISNRGYPYSVSDETPTQAVGDSKWPGIALPEGSLSIPGRVSSGLEQALYGNKDLSKLVAGCEAMANRKLFLRDLSNDYQMMIDALDEMQAHEYTNIALGAEVGWHVLSANEPFTRGVVSSKKDVKKILILLTDGMQTVPAHGPSGLSITGANEAITETCANMAVAEIEVFTIAYDLDDAFTRGLLSACASRPSNYFEPGVSSDLSGVFQQIFEDIAESVRLVR